jgi:hypothetical protein
MLSHCANSLCSKPFLRLREGKLFLVETPGIAKQEALTSPIISTLRKPPQRVEHFWLCDRCASTWTLVQNGTFGIALVPLTRPGDSGKKALLPGSKELTWTSSRALDR